jgi:hypothetical protein
VAAQLAAASGASPFFAKTAASDAGAVQAKGDTAPGSTPGAAGRKPIYAP